MTREQQAFELYGHDKKVYNRVMRAIKTLPKVSDHHDLLGTFSGRQTKEGAPYWAAIYYKDINPDQHLPEDYEEAPEYIEQSQELDHDFTNAKVGDSVWDRLNNRYKIVEIKTDSDHPIVYTNDNVFLYKSTLNGMTDAPNFPVIFNHPVSIIHAPIPELTEIDLLAKEIAEQGRKLNELKQKLEGLK